MGIGMLPTREKPESETGKVAGGKRWTLITSIFVISMVTVAGAIAFWPKPEPTAGVVQIIAPPADTRLDVGGPCNFPVPQNDTTTQLVPADVVWTLSGTMATPSSPAAGPLHVTGGVATCFAHSPSGALFAVTNLIANLGNPQLDMRAVADQRLVHSTGYDQLSLQLQDWVEMAKTTPDTNLRQIAGFRLITYSADYALIDVAQRGTGGQAMGMLAVQTYLLQWSADDWKLVPTIDAEGMPVRELDSLQFPYIAFNGA